jgi:phosphoribosyl-dephospho-CoA transferase
VPLPPAFGKRRVAVTVSARGVVKHASPPPLRVAAGAADTAWQRKIASILALGERLGLEPAVFGSLLWQYHTGLSYLTAVSDLDLLWRVPTDFALMPLLAGLAGADDGSPRLDGEIVFSDGVAINWRELWQARDSGGQVLAKTMQGLHLAAAQALLTPALTA